MRSGEDGWMEKWLDKYFLSISRVAVVPLSSRNELNALCRIFAMQNRVFLELKLLNNTEFIINSNLIFFKLASGLDQIP